MEARRGLVIVHTGSGKGKTTAALGLAMRAWGNGYKILILQFIKGSWKYGEIKAIEALGPNLKLRRLGEGFVGSSTGDEKEKHRAAAVEALAEADSALISGAWDMLILDEILYAVKFGLIDEDEVLRLIDEKPAETHLVLTGRGASDVIVECADLVTEMREIKHPYKQGIKAQHGIEF